MTRENKYWLLALAIFIYVAIVFTKAPTLFTDPRFWAEEGVVFFPRCQKGGFIECISYLHLGSYQLLANVAVYLSTKVPLVFAPSVTSFFALALQTVVAAQLFILAKAYRLSTAVALLLWSAWALLPQTFEVDMSATNMRWNAGASVLLIFAMPLEWLTERWKVCCDLVPDLRPLWRASRGLCAASSSFARFSRGRRRSWLLPRRWWLVLGCRQRWSVCTLCQTRPENTVRIQSFYGFRSSLQTIISPIASIDFAELVGKAIKSGQGGALFGALGI